MSLKYCLIPMITRGAGKCFINDTYIKFIYANGYIPIPIVMTDIDEWPHVEERLSEFNKEELVTLMPGGLDVEPTIFGYSNVGSDDCKPWVDYCEAAVLNYSIDNEIPVFGICRGLQLFFIAHYRGGIKWWQHIPGHRQTTKNGTRFHDVNMTSTILGPYEEKDANGKNKLFVNSFHHQAIQLKRNDHKLYQVVVDADHQVDNTVNKKSRFMEACRVYNRETGKLVIAAVQWHPEELVQHAELMKYYLSFDNRSEDESRAAQATD